MSQIIYGPNNMTMEASTNLKDLSRTVIEAELSSTVGIADKVIKLREQGETVYDFSAGRAFENTPQYIIDEAISALMSGKTHQTMARGTTNYRKACAKKLLRENNITADPEKEIIATMGTKQGLTIALLALLNPGDEVIIENPCFVSYQQLINFAGGISVTVPLLPENDFRWNREDLEAKITTKTKVILMNSPHNPTGTVHSIKDLEMIASVAKAHDLYVITDEVYERVCWGNKQHICLASLPGMKERTIGVMGLTKGFSMGGWRIGFVYTSPVIAEQLEKLQQHLITSTNSFVQAGAATAFGESPRDEVLQYWKEWEEKCNYVCNALNDIDGISCKVPEGGFYAWADISSFGLSSEEFSKRLIEDAKVAVIPGASFGDVGEFYIRVTCVKSWEEVKSGMQQIQKFVKKLNTK